MQAIPPSLLSLPQLLDIPPTPPPIAGHPSTILLPTPISGHPPHSSPNCRPSPSLHLIESLRCVEPAPGYKWVSDTNHLFIREVATFSRSKCGHFFIKKVEFFSTLNCIMEAAITWQIKDEKITYNGGDNFCFFQEVATCSRIGILRRVLSFRKKSKNIQCYTFFQKTP